MGLDVETPAPPELDRDTSAEDEDAGMGEGDYRRDELNGFLRDGAWKEAFARWADDTDLDESEYAVVEELGMIAQFDFFWDEFAERVGYHAPGIPEDWQEREYHPELDSWGTVSEINASMTELGSQVRAVLEEEYIDWAGEYEGPDDLPDFEE